MTSMQFPSKAHRAKAEHNVLLVDDLVHYDDKYRDWRVIGIFYAALHLVQAYAEKRTNSYPMNHQERDNLVMGDPDLKGVRRAYRELKQWSVTSRYSCLPTNDHDVSEARRHFETIRKHIETLL